MKTTRTTMILITATAMLFIWGAIAFAHGGFGYGGPMMDYGSCYGSGHMKGHGYHMRGHGVGSRLSDEELAKVDEAREKFFHATRELRGRIDEKQIALRNEMIKDDPDAVKVAKLQKELSGLQAEFDQKAVAHRLEMRKLIPGKYMGRGHGRGYGGGNCWR